MNKSFAECLQDAIARKDTSEIAQVILAFSGPFDEAGRIYGESLWCWVRDIDTLRGIITRLDYIKNPSSPPPKRKWKHLTARNIVDIFNDLFIERYGDNFRKERENLCRLILENKDKRNSLIHHFNNEVEEMSEDYKKESGKDAPYEQHLQHMLSIANQHRIKHSPLMIVIQALVFLDYAACKQQHNQPTPTDKS